LEIEKDDSRAILPGALKTGYWAAASTPNLNSDARASRVYRSVTRDAQANHSPTSASWAARVVASKTPSSNPAVNPETNLNITLSRATDHSHGGVKIISTLGVRKSEKRFSARD